MKHYLLLVVFFISFLPTFSVSSAEDNSKDQIVASLIELIKANDKGAIAQRVRYPLNRKKPLLPITNRAEFIERYDEVFDSKLINMIVTSDLQTDWRKMGWRGIMFKSGAVWLDTDGTIWSVTYESELEKQKKRILIDDQKRKLHSSLRKFEKPVLEWKTENFLVRIDDLGEGNFRYASWSIKKEMSEAPDLVLQNGEIVFEGSGGNHYYLFQNGKYKYRCYVNVIGNEHTTSGSLEVFKSDNLILTEDVKN